MRCARPQCPYENTRVDVDSVLRVQVGASSTDVRLMQSAVAEVNRTTTVDDFYCELCGAQCEGSESIAAFLEGRFVVIQAVRFRWDGNVLRRKKTGHLSIQPRLEVGEHNFTLRAVVVHVGSTIGGGHYVVYTHVRRHMRERWVLWNDSSARNVGWVDVAGAQGYLYLYERRQ